MPTRVEDDRGLFAVDRWAPAELYLLSVDSIRPRVKSSQVELSRQAKPNQSQSDSTNERLSVNESQISACHSAFGVVVAGRMPDKASMRTYSNNSATDFSSKINPHK